MKINKNRYKNLQQKKHKTTHRGASVVYDFLDKYKVDYREEWGDRLAKAMLRKQKQGTLEAKIINVEETLEWMKRQKMETPAVYKIYQGIMKDQNSKTRYFWSKLLKK